MAASSAPKFQPLLPAFSGTRGYEVVGTVRERLLDELVLIAARLFDVPIAVISLVATKGVWVRSQHGLPVELTRLPHTTSLCAAVVQRGTLLVFEDLQQHPCEGVKTPVVQQLGLRFYAGYPLAQSNGHLIGALGIMGYTPRVLLLPEKALLTSFAHLVSLLLELRTSAVESGSFSHCWQQLEQLLAIPIRRLLITANQVRQATAEARAVHWQQAQQLLTQLLVLVS